ncbi:DNA-binding protein HU-beta [Azospira sp. I13]|uniref:HU family DNA-binding protein n=1 Tax=Azospira sp. I13 TaxID=1765050 RepID=UPI000D4D8C36|nr:HU family DNA-binding protein [Azospira sp. I13]GBG03937.1 DNA-binding protein HU-beta [Azospira sp. I13]
MKQVELIAKVAEVSGASKKDVEAILKATADVVTEQLQEGDAVAFFTLGKFTIKQRSGRTGRNPKTGEPMEISAKNAPGFSFSTPLKKALNP